MIVEELIGLLGWKIEGEQNLRKFQEGLRKTSDLAERMATALVAAGTLAAGAMAALGKSVVNVSAEFEGFQTSLETIEGSAGKAKASLDWITQFAATTPYEMSEVTRAFIKLRSYGIDPMDGTLTALGDTASAMNKPLDQAVEAFADAATFQFERLREFGVTTSQKGEEVTFSWTKNSKQMTKTVKKTSDEVRKFLLNNFGDRFNGAMIRQSKTWNGMMSNLADSWTLFQKSIGDGGFFQNVKARLGSLLDYIGKLKADGTLDKWATGLSDGLTGALDFGINTVQRLVKHFNYLSDWVKDHPNLWQDIKAGLILLGGYVFPKGAAILILDDVLSYLRGAPSVIGDFAKSLADLSGIDADSIGAVLTTLAAGGAAFLLFGGSFKTAATGIRALGGALAFLGGAKAAKGLAFLQSLSGGKNSLFGKFGGIFSLLNFGEIGAHMPSTPEAWAANNKAVKANDKRMNGWLIDNVPFLKYFDNTKSDLETKAIEEGKRREWYKSITTPANQNLTLPEAFQNYQANTARSGSGMAVPTVNNAIATTVNLTVQQINEAATAAANAVHDKVSSGLSGVKIPPSRIMRSAHF